MICIVALTIGAGSWLLARGDAPTQTNEYEAPDRPRVAFIDIAQIFKRSTAFKTQMEEMKKKVEAVAEPMQRDAFGVWRPLGPTE
jgi:hypothetical protein